MDHLAAENSGHVSGTVKHSQNECAVVERLEDDQIISVCADPYLIAQVWDAPRNDQVRPKSSRSIAVSLE